MMEVMKAQEAKPQAPKAQVAPPQQPKRKGLDQKQAAKDWRAMEARMQARGALNGI